MVDIRLGNKNENVCKIQYGCKTNTLCTKNKSLLAQHHLAKHNKVHEPQVTNRCSNRIIFFYLTVFYITVLPTFTRTWFSIGVTDTQAANFLRSDLNVCERSTPKLPAWLSFVTPLNNSISNCKNRKSFSFTGFRHAWQGRKTPRVRKQHACRKNVVSILHTTQLLCTTFDTDKEIP